MTAQMLLLLFYLLLSGSFTPPGVATRPRFFDEKKGENTTRDITLSDHSTNQDIYLLPIHFILSNLYPNGTDKEVIQKALKQGHGLEPYVSDQGERGWVENGIVYRPFREQKHGHLLSKIKSPYKAEFEEYVPFNKNKFFRGRGPDTIPSKVSQMKILLWYTKTRYYPPMPGLAQLQVCPDFPCVMTSNKTFLNESAALLFAAQLMEPNPPPRRQDQIFIFHNHEVPGGVHVKYVRRKTSKWKGAFNWTMTFRMDSDIPAFYGAVRKRPIPLQRDYKLILSNKTKPVAWLVSHCNTRSNRDLYGQELNKYIPVDVYGNCGKLRCGIRKKDDQCMHLLSRQYKFYLAFESSICLDYITEKLFKYFSLDLIIVGRASNGYYKHLPLDIFINADDYPSPKALAERLNFLDKNNEEYIHMLRNKDKYISIMQAYPILHPSGQIKYMTYRKEEVSFCYICYRLWNIDRYSKTIPDVLEWFNQGKCKKRSPI